MGDLIRPSIADGILYYNDEQELQNFIKSSIATNNIAKEGKPFAVISPNAGYLLAGNAYGAAYSQLLNEHYDTVIIISQAHKMSFYSIALSESSAFETPLGLVSVDQESNEILKQYNRDYIIDGEKYHLSDSSIELQLPYLLEALDENISILPILMGEPNTKFTILLSKALKHLMETSDKKFLIVITTNLSNEFKAEKAAETDAKFIEILKQKNSDYMAEQLALNQVVADGGGGIVSLLRLFELTEERRFSLLKYFNSADITKDQSKVEGYMAGIFL